MAVIDVAMYLDRNQPANLAPDAPEPPQMLVQIDDDLSERFTAAVSNSEWGIVSLILLLQAQRDFLTELAGMHERLNNDHQEVLAVLSGAATPVAQHELEEAEAEADEKEHHARKKPVKKRAHKKLSK